MKKIFCILIFLCSFSSFASLDHAYRFHLNLISNDGLDTISGYFYHYTEIEYKRENDKSFIGYIDKDQITIYTYLNTVNFNQLDIDFTLEKFKKEIDLNNYWHIRIYEFLDFSLDSRLVVLTENEYNLLKPNPPNFEVIDFCENCRFIIFNWDENKNLTIHSKEIIGKIALYNQDEIKNQDWFFNYINSKKKDLLKEGIILTYHSEPL